MQLIRANRQPILMAARVFGIVFLCGVVLTVAGPRLYEARMKILVNSERADVVVTPAQNGAMDQVGDVGETAINSEIGLLSSRDVLRDVIARVGGAEGQPGAISNPRELERAVVKLERALDITPLRKANIIQIQCRGRAPERVVAVLRSLGDVYLAAHLKAHAASGSYEFFRAETMRYQTELQQAQAALHRLEQMGEMVLPAEKEHLVLEERARLEAALTQAERYCAEIHQRQLTLHRQLEEVPESVVAHTRTFPNPYAVERLSTMLAELQNRRTGLLTKFKPDDRFVQEVDRQIADTTTALAQARSTPETEHSTERNALHVSIETDLAKAGVEAAEIAERKAQLVQEIRDYGSRLGALAKAATQYQNLTRQAKEAEDNYVLYARKQEESRVADALDRQKITNVAIIENPMLPYAPIRPNMALNLGLSLILALGSGISAGLATEHFRQSSGRIAPEPESGAGSAHERTGKPLESGAHA